MKSLELGKKIVCALEGRRESVTQRMEYTASILRYLNASSSRHLLSTGHLSTISPFLHFAAMSGLKPRPFILDFEE
jgi:hypothetical protein